MPWKVTDQRPGPGERRAPTGKPVVGVDEVEALAAQPAADLRGSRGGYSRLPERERKQLGVDARRAQRRDLVADEAAAPRGGGSGVMLVTTRTLTGPAYPRRAEFSAGATRDCHGRVWIGDAAPGEHRHEANTKEEFAMSALAAG